MAVSYTNGFYASFQAGSRSSAERVLPMVLELAPARSVVDVGCGIGTWLSVCQSLGVTDVQGLDGPWVDAGQFMLPRERFKAVDLTKPVDLGGRRFDLALSMEVAEHLPEAASRVLVRTLTELAPVVLFSAALPGQGGIDHVNEQWPAYWAERFAERGFRAIDCLRGPLWLDETVEWWYRQNALLFASDEALAAYPRLRAAADQAPRDVRPLVHPECLAIHTCGRVPLRIMVRAFPSAVREALRNRLGV
jgi:SAM-dependent methyltransferase